MQDNETDNKNELCKLSDPFRVSPVLFQPHVAGKRTAGAAPKRTRQHLRWLRGHKRTCAETASVLERLHQGSTPDGANHQHPFSVTYLARDRDWRCIHSKRRRSPVEKQTMLMTLTVLKTGHNICWHVLHAAKPILLEEPGQLLPPTLVWVGCQR